MRYKAARHLTLKPSLRKHRGCDPQVRSDSVAERVRKDLECAQSGPVARVDVTMSCSKNGYSRAREWLDRDGRPAAWSMSTSTSRGAPTLASSKLLLPKLLSPFPASGPLVDRGQIRNIRPHFSCGFAVGAKARGP